MSVINRTENINHSVFVFL